MKPLTSVAFHTLGCKLNYSETATLSRTLQAAGFDQKNFDEKADVYVLNTCSVTENADKECRLLVRRVRRQNPEGFVVITGCYAQLKPKEIASVTGADLVLGAAEKFNLLAHLQGLIKTKTPKIYSCEIEEINDFVPSFSISERTRSFLKIQDGCDYGCSFCTIPLARGKSRSDTTKNILRNIETLVQQGVKEVVLTGINLGDYGKCTDENENAHTFLDVLQALEEKTEMPRYRISSIEPNLLTEGIIRFVAQSKKIMPHFHIPLQSGSNTILARMRRRYKCELYAEKIQQIKCLMPYAAIGADVLVGFPTEDKKAFEETHQFLQHIDISYLHVFTYSERPNTAALHLQPIVPINTRHERNQILRNLGVKKLEYFTQQHAGTQRNVLFEEHEKHGRMEGYTDNYIRISVPYNKAWANQIIPYTVCKNYYCGL